MPTELALTKPLSLFLFAHQDDEFAVYQTIVDELENGHRVCCAYLTTGVKSGQSAQCRNDESVAVLTRIGVSSDDVYFVGETLGIHDGTLPDRLTTAVEWFIKWLSGHPLVHNVFVPAWEGGHQDHDALHALAVLGALQLGIVSRVAQFPLYNGYRCRGPLFRVLSPLDHNGAIHRKRIPLMNRIRFVRHCLRYRSQAKSWVGLFPFVLLHYLVNGTEATQPVLVDRILERPHDGALYYERRKFFTWREMQRQLSNQIENSELGLVQDRTLDA